MFCYYTVVKFHWKPHEYAFLPEKERVMVMAFIQEQVKAEEENRRRLKPMKGGR